MYGCRRKGVKALKTYHHHHLHRQQQAAAGSISTELRFMHKKLQLLAGETNSAPSARNFITPGNSKAPFYCQSRF